MREPKTRLERTIRDLYDGYVDACTMCTSLECESCAIKDFISELEEAGVDEIISSNW